MSNRPRYNAWPKDGIATFPPDLAREIVADYRSTFLGSDHGRRCLKHLMSYLCFFRDVETEEERIKRNSATAILSFCGMWGGPGFGVEDDFVDKMSSVDVTERIRTEGEEDA